MHDYMQLNKRDRHIITEVCTQAGFLKINLWKEVATGNYRRSGNFRCKNIFVVCANNENKKHEINFTTDNHLYSQIFVHTISHHSYM